MLGISSSLNMFICLLSHSLAYFALDLGKVGNIAIVHDSVNTKCKGMVVCWRNSCCGSSSDVCKYHLTACVAAD